MNLNLNMFLIGIGFTVEQVITFKNVDSVLMFHRLKKPCKVDFGK